MNKNMAFLDYTFLFNPVETWQHLSQFESDLADFFATLGLEAEIVKSVNGQPGKRLLLIQRVKSKVNEITPTPMRSPKEQLKDLRR